MLPDHLADMVPVLLADMVQNLLPGIAPQELDELRIFVLRENFHGMSGSSEDHGRLVR